MNLNAPLERSSSHLGTSRSQTQAVSSLPKRDPKINNGSEISTHTWISYSNVIYPTATRSQLKEINLRVRPSSLRRKERSQRFQPQAQVKLLNLGMRPKSEMEISPSAPTIPLAKPIGHGNARVARHRETILERKQGQIQHPVDAPSASTIQGCRRIR